MTLESYFQSAKKSIFRFEYLQEFDDPEERYFFRNYEANGIVEIRHLMQDWWDFLESKHKEKVSSQRVRLVRLPLTKYLEWELHIYREALKHGDDITILEENNLTPELENLGDFWLIDDSIALKMKYDSRGSYIGFEKAESEPYIQTKEYLLKNSIPLL